MTRQAGRALTLWLLAMLAGTAIVWLTCSFIYCSN
jgi:hypothetical protein